MASIAELVGIVGGLRGAASLYYAVQQTNLMKLQIDELKTKSAEDETWVEEFDKVVKLLLRIHALWLRPEGGGMLNAYGAVFPDPEFRAQIERYLIEFDQQRQVRGRPLDVHMLRLETVRHVIRDVKMQAERFKDNHPEYRVQLGD